MKNKFLLAVVLMLSMLTVSCEKDKPVEPVVPPVVEPVDPSGSGSSAVFGSIIVDVSNSWEQWNYVSLKTGKIVGKGKIGADDAEWKSSADWDIAFSRTHAKTNSGTSGNSNGGAIEIGADETDKAKAFISLVNAPTSGYVVDLMAPVLTSMPPKDVKASINLEIAKWLGLGMPMKVFPKVFALKTGDGKYAKIYLKHYIDDEGKNGRIGVDYAYQPDGSTSLTMKQ